MARDPSIKLSVATGEKGVCHLAYTKASYQNSDWSTLHSFDLGVTWRRSSRRVRKHGQIRVSTTETHSRYE